MRISLKSTYLYILLVINLLSCQKLFSYDIQQAPLTLQEVVVPEEMVPEEMVIDPIFLPVVFTGKVLPEIYLKNNLYENPKLSDIEEIIPNNMVLNMPPSFIEQRKREQELNREAYLYLTLTEPSIVKYTLNDFPKKTEVIEQMKVNPFKNLFEVETDNLSPSGEETLTKFIFRKYWFVEGNHLLQFSQSYISHNWNNGGIGNLNFLSNQNVNVHYEKSIMQFNTFLEWNTSLFTNPNDTLRRTRIGTDLLRSFSNLGFRLFNHWYYSTNLELRTQVFNNYDENATTKVSSFMSPFLLNYGILGMRYELDKKFKYDKYKSIKFAADLSPLSIRYISVSDPGVDATRYGIPEGKNSRLDYGSTVNATLAYNINRSTSLKSRFKYFTSFKKVEVESENDINFSINRYFSTRIYLYLRYDDSESITPDPTLGYLQVNELVSFGFNYKW